MMHCFWQPGGVTGDVWIGSIGEGHWRLADNQRYEKT
jgi:hypothetical protein